MMHKVLLTMTIVAWLLTPDIILTLVSPMACFKSIASERNAQELTPPPPPDITVMRMSILPDEYCGGDFHSSLVIYTYPGLFLYAFLLPLIFLRQAAVKSHIIYRTGCPPETLDGLPIDGTDEEV